MQDHVSRLVGLDDFEVKDVIEAGDQLDLEVELVARAALCPHCGRAALEVKERPVVRVRDLPIAGRTTQLRWRKRRFQCQRCGRTFTESHPELPERQRVTARFRRRLFERTRSGGAHAEIAREEQTTRYQVTRAFAVGAPDELAARRAHGPVRRLSLDEAAQRRGGALVTVVSDLDRRRVVDVLEGRDGRTVRRYLRALPAERRRAIEVVAIDPWDAYREAIRAELPGARIALDPFHLVRGAGEALDTVRRQRQRGSFRRRRTTRRAQRSSWRAELLRSRHRLKRGAERLSERDRRKLCALFEHDPLIAEAWGLKEAFRSIYRAGDRAEAERRLDAFLAAVERAALPSFKGFAKGIVRWREELLGYFDEPTTNGYAEGVINKVKVIKRRAYGLPSFDGFRDRILLACG
jgi:transposase